MAMQIDVQAQLDEESAQKVATDLRALAKQAVLDGIADAVREITTETATLLSASLSGALAGNVGDTTETSDDAES